MSPKVFLITGTSTGFGNELVKTVLSKGDTVVATARDPTKLKFDNTSSSNYLSLKLDVTDRKTIEAAFKEAISKFGRVDVVVNNAGYGLSGEFESLSEHEIRQQMEVNFFGLLDVTRVAMETMREQKPSGGLIQQVTSIGGLNGVPTFSVYCASKFAVEGFTDAVRKEVKPEWGIKFTCVEPGGFRTDWAGRSMAFSEKKNPAYDHLNAKETMGKRHGTQAGDPPKAAEAMYKLAYEKDPPTQCILGSDAHKTLTEKLSTHQKSIKQYESITMSTDVDEKK